MTTNSSLDENALLRRMIVRLSRLVEISVTLNSTLILDDLLQFIVHSAADILDCEAATILLHEENTQQLYFAAETDTDPGEIKEEPVPMDGSIVGTVFREDRPIILNEVSLDAEAFIKVQDYTGLEVRSLIAVPLRIQDEVTGVLESVNKRGGYFDEGDLQTLTNIASQAAVAINNARLLAALTKAYENVFTVSFEQFRDTVISYLSPEDQTVYNSPSLWDEIRLKTGNFIKELKKQHG